MSKVLALVLLLGAVAFLAPAPGADAAVLGKGKSKKGFEGGPKSPKSPKSPKKSKKGKKEDDDVERTDPCLSRRLRSRRGKGPKSPKSPKSPKKSKKGKKRPTGPEEKIFDDCPEERGPITGILSTATTTVTLGLPGDSDRTPTELTDIANSYKASLDAAFASAGDDDTFILSITIDDGSGSPVIVTYEDYGYESARIRRQTDDGSGLEGQSITVTITYFTAGTGNSVGADVSTTIATTSAGLGNYISGEEVTETAEEKTITPIEEEGTRAPVGAGAVQSAIVQGQGTKYVAPNYTAPTKQSAAGAIMAVGALSIGVALAVLAVQVSRRRGRQNYEILDEEYSPSFVAELEAEIEPLVD
jgi:hypothetical protein